MSVMATAALALVNLPPTLQAERDRITRMIKISDELQASAARLEAMIPEFQREGVTPKRLERIGKTRASADKLAANVIRDQVAFERRLSRVAGGTR